MGNKDTALVVGVGASHGLGAAAARRFAREGLHVVVAGRTAEKVERVAEEISASGGSAEAVTGDAAIEENAIRFVETAEAKGPLAIVLQNSGSNRQDPFLELAAADFETIWREHCLAGFLTGRESARRMVPRGSLRGSALYAAFGAAKAGLRAVSQSMAREFGPMGIHVAHVIIDGGISGDRLKSRFPDAEKTRGSDGLLSIDAIAEAYWQLHLQHRSAWTLEQDLRPWTEKF